MVRGEHGHVDIDMDLVLRFNYGQAVPWVRRRDYGISAIAGPDAVELHTQAPLEGQDLRTVSRFTVHAGEHVPSRCPIIPRTRFRISCRTAWKAWTARWPGGRNGPSAAARTAASRNGTRPSCAR